VAAHFLIATVATAVFYFASRTLRSLVEHVIIAGLLYGVANDWDWQRTGRLASTLGALKIASRGGQNHALTRDRVASAYHAAFHAELW